ncbi:MAG: phosphoribosylanthranilate isomerase [Oscillatoria sp. PMC 1068.18]|nr:phosphoribosylanthranilate isomerase [Oscillatoria sp. PMC 1076.18]MEC4987791.1 phosphoribosylanthranilate isomerase [Oscillatoria sp. PMC 1068.18]
MRVKICGITKPEQGIAIANLGATALGFICVRESKRYVDRSQIKAIVNELPLSVERIAVFANATLPEITEIVLDSSLTGVQLHGDETPEFCQRLKKLLPNIEIIKALRVQNQESLAIESAYTNSTDTLLLDAYNPKLLGGTGETLNWEALSNFRPTRPWLLAGGLTPENILSALEKVKPDGIDLSSGVERSPGDKDLAKVAQLFARLQHRKNCSAKQ